MYYKTNQSYTETFSLTGALSVTTQDYHIYSDIVSSATDSSGDYVTLDQDNIDGIVSTCSATGNKCGPESITISKVRNSGTYRFHVHAWSAKGTNGTEIADNKTYVQVFYNIDKSKTFHAPKEAGELWTVFDYNNSTSTNDGFTHINAMSSQGSPENVDNH